jgi:hypothetical protein
LKKVLYIYITIGVFCFCFTKIKEQGLGNFKISYIDVLHNVYLISQDNTIKKYQNNQLKYAQNYKIYGNVSSVDFSNPLEGYIFYKDANNIVFLDNTLSFRGILDLSKTQVGMATAMCRSYDNGIWLFDQTDLQVKKINKSGDIIQTSGNPIFISNKQLNPTYMVEDGNNLYIADTINGIIITDINAIYKSTIPIKGIKQIYIYNKKIYYALEKYIYEIDLKTLSKKVLKETSLPASYNSFVNDHILLLPSVDSIYTLVPF